MRHRRQEEKVWLRGPGRIFLFLFVMVFSFAFQSVQAQSVCGSFQEKTQLKPDNVTVWTLWGHCLYKQEEYAKALKAYEKALALSSEKSVLSQYVEMAKEKIASSQGEKITLNDNPPETPSLWQSPWIPISMSFVAPGSGQLYSGISDSDWFGILRGSLYLGLVSVAYWQMFEGINSQDAGRINIWSGVLLGVNVLAPLDAWLTTTVLGKKP